MVHKYALDVNGVDMGRWAAGYWALARQDGNRTRTSDHFVIVKADVSRMLRIECA
jgi:hypothetical protein